MGRGCWCEDNGDGMKLHNNKPGGRRVVEPMSQSQRAWLGLSCTVTQWGPTPFPPVCPSLSICLCAIVVSVSVHLCEVLHVRKGGLSVCVSITIPVHLSSFVHVHPCPSVNPGLCLSVHVAPLCLSVCLHMLPVPVCLSMPVCLGEPLLLLCCQCHVIEDKT